MEWKRIASEISFNDPESRFDFRTDRAGLQITFRDWQNRAVQIRFCNFSHFQFGYLCPLPGLPDYGFYALADSALVSKLRDTGFIGPGEAATHFLLASNEDEYCEVVAESFKIAITD